jgi:hypothetical protein
MGSCVFRGDSFASESWPGFAAVSFLESQPEKAKTARRAIKRSFMGVCVEIRNTKSKTGLHKDTNFIYCKHHHSL